MAWLVIKTALKECRARQGLTIDAVAELTGLNRRTLERLESPTGTRTIRYETAELLARFYKCNPDDFCKWVPDTEAFAAPELPEGTVVAVGRSRRLTTGAHKLVAPNDAVAFVKVGDGVGYRLVSALQLHHLHLASRAFVNDRYAVQGVVARADSLSPRTASEIGAPNAVGVRCVIRRDVDGSDPLGVTVLTKQSEHTRRLLEARARALPITVIARVIVSPDDGSYPGFRALPEIRGKRVPFALLVEELPEMVSLYYDAE